jgi:hypothetical protein
MMTKGKIDQFEMQQALPAGTPRKKNMWTQNEALE